MDFNEFREKVKEALPNFVTDDLRNTQIQDAEVNKLQSESYSGITITPEENWGGQAFMSIKSCSALTGMLWKNWTIKV